MHPSEADCGDVPNRLDVADNWSFLLRAYKPDVEASKNDVMPDVVLVEKHD